MAKKFNKKKYIEENENIVKRNISARKRQQDNCRTHKQRSVRTIGLSSTYILGFTYKNGTSVHLVKLDEEKDEFQLRYTRPYSGNKYCMYCDSYSCDGHCDHLAISYKYAADIIEEVITKTRSIM